jgi:hypothetical protein
MLLCGYNANGIHYEEPLSDDKAMQGDTNTQQCTLSLELRRQICLLQMLCDDNDPIVKASVKFL